MTSGKFQTLILTPTPGHIQQCVDLLEAGEVVGMPTETVYGLAGNALNLRAVAKIFDVKKRPRFDPLIVHISDRYKEKSILDRLTMLELIDGNLLGGNAIVRIQKLIENYWPGPMTLILPRGPAISDLVTSGLPTVAVRMPSHPVARSLLSKLEFPLAAPSANRFGRISPTTAADVKKELDSWIPVILDGGKCEVGLESTVIEIHSGGDASVLRPGFITGDDIRSTLGIELSDRHDQQAHEAPSSPGQLASHYAPEKTLLRLDEGSQSHFISAVQNGKEIGLLLVDGMEENILRLFNVAPKNLRIWSLGSSDDRAQQAQRLFATLREMDESPATELWTEIPQTSNATHGLAHAIADRLMRASRAV